MDRLAKARFPLRRLEPGTAADPQAPAIDSDRAVPCTVAHSLSIYHGLYVIVLKSNPDSLSSRHRA